MMQRNKMEEYEKPPLVIQRATRDFQTGRSVACVAWNPHRGRECELAVGFSYWVGSVFAALFSIQCVSRGGSVNDHLTILHLIG